MGLMLSETFEMVVRVAAATCSTCSTPGEGAFKVENTLLGF
jgi:hypothetical protein